MKIIVTIILMLNSLLLFSQHQVCEKRGHIWYEYQIRSPYCPPYIYENDTIGYLITPNCQQIVHICLRCRKEWVKEFKSDTTILWQIVKLRITKDIHRGIGYPNPDRSLNIIHSKDTIIKGSRIGIHIPNK